MSTSSTPTVPTHGADAAGGGEEIFSSDGLDALPKPPPRLPPIASTASAASKDGGEVTDEGLSPAQAFEVFSGKVYPVPNNKHNNSKLAWKETAVERLARLQAELAELQQDLTHQEDTDVSLADLQKVQASLEQTRLNMHWTTPTLPPQPSSTTSTAAPVAASAPASGLEGRLQQLEGLVGGGGKAASTTSSNMSLSARLAALEALAPADNNWEATQKRAKVIRQDLEAAAKARNKLSSSNNNSLDVKAVTELYDLQQQLSGCAPHLPALVQRLQQLAHLHASQATFSARLQATEDVAIRLQTAVAVAEQAVDQMQTSLETNLQAMQDNVQVLTKQA